MINAIHAEWIKFRTVRSTIVLACFIVALSVALAVLTSSLSKDVGPLAQDAGQRLTTVLAGVQGSQLLVGVLAALMITQEYRFSTIRATLSALPHRPRVFAAKTATLLAVVTVAATLLLAVSLVLAALIFKLRDTSFSIGGGTAWRIIGGTLLYMASYALACLGIGAIIRSSAGAIVLGLVWPLVIEPAAGAVFAGMSHESWARWLPFLAGGQLVRVDRGDGLGPWAGWTYFTLFSLALLGFGYWLFERRDA